MPPSPPTNASLRPLVSHTSVHGLDSWWRQAVIRVAMASSNASAHDQPPRSGGASSPCLMRTPERPSWNTYSPRIPHLPRAGTMRAGFASAGRQMGWCGRPHAAVHSGSSAPTWPPGGDVGIWRAEWLGVWRVAAAAEAVRPSPRESRRP